MREIGENEFVIAKHNKRHRRKFKHKYLPVEEYDNISDISSAKIFKQLDDANDLLRTSKQIDAFISALDKCATHIDDDDESENKNKVFAKCVCYGIGRISRNYQALHQLALLLLLKSHYEVPVFIYDPILSETEIEILKKLNLTLIEENEEGKRKVDSNTIFFLPHCPRQLLNNLLWSNWGKSLSNCIILGNKHSDIITNTPPSVLRNFWYLAQIAPAVTEYDVPNIYRYDDVFNDLAAHTFVPEKLNNIPADVWEYKNIPTYNNEDAEFIRNSENS